MDILSAVRKIDGIESKYNLSFDALKSQTQISKTKEIQKWLKEINQDKSLLRIGIIGRVKAGKSSLLNALIFNANDVLPEAATPMTAALTIIKYSDTLSANVDIFSDDDINDFKNSFNRFNKLLLEITNKNKNELLESYAKKESVKMLDPNRIIELKIDEKARQRALTELKQDESLYAGYEQYKSLENAKKPEQTKIKANSINELKEKLENYVGANGAYTPYTKSITLYLNEPSLKGIEIIDTPGVCDPVASRGERTSKMLKTCHVAFLLSPAGQFLSEQDVMLMDKVYGANEITLSLIASKVDTEIFGSEKDKNDANLAKVLASIKAKFNERLKEFCSHKKDALWDELAKNEVIISSGLAYKILNNMPNLNEFENHMLNLYKQNYEKEFSNDLNASLNALANLDKIHKMLDFSRQNKDKIIQEKNDNYIRIESEKIKDYINLVCKKIDEKILKLNKTDLNDLKTKKEALKARQDEIKTLINEAYNEQLDNFDSVLTKPISEKLSLELKAGVSKVEKNKKTKVKTEQYSETEYKRVEQLWRKALSWTGFVDECEWVPYEVTKIRSYEIIRVSSDKVYDGLLKMCEKLENILNEELKIQVEKYKDNTLKNVKKALKGQELNLDELSLDSVIKAFCFEKFYLQIPRALMPKGTLENEDANKYINNTKKFLNSLETLSKGKLNDVLDELFDGLKDYDLAEGVLKEYYEMQDDLENKLKDKQGAINEQKAIKKEYLKIIK